jgi:protein tyrosine phosphatase (PTP) superfamily phosphohydrolase (DUF442 family)
MLSDILNYLPLTDTIGTAGQPTADQFTDIQAAGYEVVVNLALPTSTNALPNERETVTELSMDYVPIPVVWDAPTRQNLEAFFETMDRYRDKKVFVHCAMNMRVSAFMFLYRVIRQREKPEVAREPMLKIWQPSENAVWQHFIDDALVRDTADT